MSPNSFDLLSDDALAAIGVWIVSTGTENLTRCLQVCRRFRSVWGAPGWHKQIIRERVLDRDNRCDTGMTSLEHLALYEAVEECGLWEENRIGFDYASVSVAHDGDGHRNRFGLDATDILGSHERISRVARIMRKFPNTFVRIDAHTGTAAPPRIADRFSVARGTSVMREILDLLTVTEYNMDDEEEEESSALHQRLQLTPWGMRISESAAASEHPFGRLARQGKGWVELYLCLGGNIEFPSRPSFYQGQTWLDDDSSDLNMFHVNAHHGMHGSDGSSGESVQDRPMEDLNDEDDDEEEDSDGE